MSEDMVFYDRDPVSKILGWVKIMEKPNHKTIVKYEFNYPNEPGFFFEHAYTNLLDFVFNPKNKYDFSVKTQWDLKVHQMNHTGNLAKLNLAAFNSEENVELKNLLTSYNITPTEGLYNLYHSVNNIAIQKLMESLLHECVPVSEYSFINVTAGNMRISVKKVKKPGCDSSIFYKGSWFYKDKKFEWIHPDPYVLLHVLDSEARACFNMDFGLLGVCLYRAKYMLTYSMLLDDQWELKHKTQSYTRKTKGRSEKKTATISIFESADCFAAKIIITIGYQSGTEWVQEETLYAYMYHPVLEELLNQIEHGDELLSLLIDDYDHYQHLVKKCVHKLQSKTIN